MSRKDNEEAVEKGSCRGGVIPGGGRQGAGFRGTSMTQPKCRDPGVMDILIARLGAGWRVRQKAGHGGPAYRAGEHRLLMECI